MTAREIAERVKRREMSAADVVKSSLDRIDKFDRDVNACVTVVPDRAIAAAERIDSMIAKGEDPGPLAGVPFIVKDNLCTDGILTTCGSRMLKDWTPMYDATAVSLLTSSGAVLVAKANMDEFAMGSTTESSIHGPTKNPRSLDRVPGGSSGGSAAAVSAGYVPIAIGTDTGGSVRQPAAFCGVQGFKPSYGQVSRYGVVAYCSSLDQVSPFARTVDDIALTMDVIARADVRDMTCDAYDRPSFSDAVRDHCLKGKRIGVFAGFKSEDMDPELYRSMQHAAEICRAAGAEIEAIELPIAVKYGVAAYYITALADASSKLACYDGIRYGAHADGGDLALMYENTRTEAFGDEVRRRIILGTCLLTEGFYENYYGPALKVRTKIAEEFDSAFERFDAYILPTSPSLPYRLGERETDPRRIYLGDIFTVPISLAGLPGISVCMGATEDGLPLSAQIVGPRYGDAEVLGIASVIESVAGAPSATDPMPGKGAA